MYVKYNTLEIQNQFTKLTFIDKLCAKYVTYNSVYPLSFSKEYGLPFW